MDLSNDHWLQAQYSCLGAALIAPEAVSRVLSGTTAGDYTGTCRAVFEAMHKVYLSGTPVDPVSVSHQLEPEYRPFLMELMEITPTAANVDHYIRLCREQAQTLAVKELAMQMAQADTGETLRSLLDRAEKLLAHRPTTAIVSTHDALQDFHTRHTRPADYLRWPLPGLDTRLYVEPGDLIILGGAPSAGKSAFALQCAWHWASDHSVGFFSLETSAQKLFDRQMAACTGIPMEDIKGNCIRQEGWELLRRASEDISARRLDYISAAGMTVADIRALTIRRGYQVILIDYLQLIQGGGENRTAQVTAISIALHTLAQSLGVTVLALSQLSRSGPGAEKPTMHHLRESGQIEQDADVILLLSLANKDRPEGPRILQIAKNKEGTRGKMLLDFDGRHQTFHKSG